MRALSAGTGGRLTEAKAGSRGELAQALSSNSAPPTMPCRSVLHLAMTHAPRLGTFGRYGAVQHEPTARAVAVISYECHDLSTTGCGGDHFPVRPAGA